jgi:hypothetical protein
LLWDNYPVNDLSMSDELHLGPLAGRDRRLPEVVYGYLSNPLLQENLSFIPLATCFDYAANPSKYKPESSWLKFIEERFGSGNVRHWRAIRAFCAATQRAKKMNRPVRLPRYARARLKAALAYIRRHREQGWAREMAPWRDLMLRNLERS